MSGKNGRTTGLEEFDDISKITLPPSPVAEREPGHDPADRATEAEEELIGGIPGCAGRRCSTPVCCSAGLKGEVASSLLLFDEVHVHHMVIPKVPIRVRPQGEPVAVLVPLWFLPVIQADGRVALRFE